MAAAALPTVSSWSHCLSSASAWLVTGSADDKGQTYILIKAVEGLLKQHGKLPIGLTESYQSDRGGHQIGEIALQEGGPGPRGWNALPRRTNSKNDGEGRLNMAFAEYLRKPV